MPSKDLVLVKDRIPRSGKGPDNLLTQLGQYLNEPANKLVQKIVVESTKTYIYFERLADRTAEEIEPSLNFHDAIRQVSMEEVAFDAGVTPSPTEYLFAMFRLIHFHGYEASHLLIGPSSDVYDWMKLQRRSERLFGTPIIKVPELPNDVLILCGSRTRESDPEDIEFAVKGTI